MIQFEKQIMRTLRRVAVMLAAAAAVCNLGACSSDERVSEEPYVYFGDQTELITYTILGGNKTLEMYCNQGPWVIETAYPEDQEWVDVWPNEGNRDARFKVTVAANTGAYTRTTTVNVVVGGKVIKSFRISQEGGEAHLKLDMGSDKMNASARESELTVSLDTNIGWLPVAEGDAKEWISFGEATDKTQVVKIKANPGDERVGTVRFQAIGTGFEELYTSVHISQFDQAHDPYNGTQKSIRELLASLPAGDATTISENIWVEGYVTSDPSKLNFPGNQMFLQDASGRGLMFEFASAKDNLFVLNEKLKVHLYNAQIVIDPVTRSRKVASFTSGGVFDRADGGEGIAPVELDYIENLDDYENTLVTFKNVEFAVPVGTYVNIDEREKEKSQGNPSSLPYCDGTHYYGHLLRDSKGNGVKLYSRDTFLDRVAVVMPQGSGPVTGIISKYTKKGLINGMDGDVTSNIMTLRSHADNKVSTEASQRLSKTLIQFGPLTGYGALDKFVSSVGNAQFKTSTFDKVIQLGGTGGTSMGWSYSYARRAPATINISSTGAQTINPVINNSNSTPDLVNIFFCIEAQKFWDATGSKINREGMDPEAKGEAWIMNVEDFNSSGGDLYFIFTAASSQTGPMYFDLEWCANEDAPIKDWKKFGEHINPDWYTCLQCQQYAYPLPAELKSLKKFTIRMRVSKNLCAGVGMVNGKEGAVTIATGGSPRFGFLTIVEKK